MSVVLAAAEAVWAGSREMDVIVGESSSALDAFAAGDVS